MEEVATRCHTLSTHMIYLHAAARAGHGCSSFFCGLTLPSFRNENWAGGQGRYTFRRQRTTVRARASFSRGSAMVGLRGCLPFSSARWQHLPDAYFFCTVCGVGWWWLY